MDPEFDAKAFSNNGDTLEAGRKKVFIPGGTSNKITFIPEQKAPSQEFSPPKLGEYCALSLAEPPSLGGLFSSDNTKPGIAVKFFVDDLPSLNTFAMPSLTGKKKLIFLQII